MNELARLVTNLEIAIRYLLTGVVVTSLLILSIENGLLVLRWMQDNLVATGALTAAMGFITFSLYRMFFWTLADFIAWKAGLSAPSLYGSEGFLYDRPYSMFLKWRRDGKALSEDISGYLTYRWAVSHFSSVSGFSAVIAASLSQPEAPISSYSCYVLAFGWLIVGLGLWQSFFLFRVERNLCENTDDT
ncbi:MAG: hypothetical protein HUJ31_08360 [Pseudomonadales bacterium]|nr:hypothetical protein [Pseudomonadales bacterium]